MVLPVHGRFDYSPLPNRPDYSWPDGKRLAIYVVLNIETFGFGMEVGPVLGNPLPMPDHRNWSWREYGNRVGVWRLFELFDQLQIPVSHQINSYLYDTHPEIMDAIRTRGDEIIGHGRTNSEQPGMRPEAEEKALIAEATSAIARHEGRAPAGWMTPLMAESRVTPDLLKEAGYQYLVDWPCDDQPYWMRTRAGPILNIPYAVETNDFIPILHLRHDIVQFMDATVRQFEEMVEQSAKQPLVLAISLHTFIMGQPHRLRVLREGLQRMLKHPRFDRVWLTRPGDIARYCEKLPTGTIPGR
jgi:allantoinase